MLCAHVPALGRARRGGADDGKHTNTSKPKLGPPLSNTTWWTDRRLRWHASPVASLDDLPPLIKTALVEQLKPGETIRQIISAPRQHMLGSDVTGWRRWLSVVLPWDWTPDWTLVVTGGRLLVAASASPDEKPDVTITPISDLLALSWGRSCSFRGSSGPGRPRAGWNAHASTSTPSATGCFGMRCCSFAAA